jgi:hypothetical protein
MHIYKQADAKVHSLHACRRLRWHQESGPQPSPVADALPPCMRTAYNNSECIVCWTEGGRDHSPSGWDNVMLLCSEHIVERLRFRGHVVASTSSLDSILKLSNMDVAMKHLPFHKSRPHMTPWQNDPQQHQPGFGFCTNFALEIRSRLVRKDAISTTTPVGAPTCTRVQPSRNQCTTETLSRTPYRLLRAHGHATRWEIDPLGN